MIFYIARCQCESNRNSTIVSQSIVLYSSRKTGVYRYYSLLSRLLKEKSACFKKKNVCF